MTGIAPMGIRAGLSVRETLSDWSGQLSAEAPNGRRALPRDSFRNDYFMPLMLGHGRRSGRISWSIPL